MAIGYGPPGDWLTVKQAARLINVVPMTIYRMVALGKIKSYTFGGSNRIRIKTEDLIQPRTPTAPSYDRR